MPSLITITGPIAAGKNTVATLLAEHYTSSGSTVVIVDVDDVAAMVAGPGAGAAGLWFAAHEAHGALVAQWMRSSIDWVIAVGPVYTQTEQRALFGALPPEVGVCRVLIDAPMSATWKRVDDDPTRGVSRQREFHTRAHERFRSLVDDIPRDLTFNSGQATAAEIAESIVSAGNRVTSARPAAVIWQLRRRMRRSDLATNRWNPKESQA